MHDPSEVDRNKSSQGSLAGPALANLPSDEIKLRNRFGTPSPWCPVSLGSTTKYDASARTSRNKSSIVGAHRRRLREAAVELLPSWTKAGSWTLGRDPLGMQATSVSLGFPSASTASLIESCRQFASAVALGSATARKASGPATTSRQGPPIRDLRYQRRASN